MILPSNYLHAPSIMTITSAPIHLKKCMCQSFCIIWSVLCPLNHFFCIHEGSIPRLPIQLQAGSIQQAELDVLDLSQTSCASHYDVAIGCAINWSTIDKRQLADMDQWWGWYSVVGWRCSVGMVWHGSGLGRPSCWFVMVAGVWSLYQCVIIYIDPLVSI